MDAFALRFMVWVLGSLLCSQQAQAEKNVQCCHVNTSKHPVTHRLSLSDIHDGGCAQEGRCTCEKRKRGSGPAHQMKALIRNIKSAGQAESRVQVLPDRCIYCDTEVVFPQSPVIEGII